MAEHCVWEPQPGPQTDLVTCPVFEILFGGARGGGKTDGMLGEWLSHAQDYGEHAIGRFFRRERTQLKETIERAKAIYMPLGAKWRDVDKEFVFPNGARLAFAYLDNDGDAEAYQGHSYTRIYFEELTNFPDAGPVLKMMATLRSGAGAPVGFRATANPGGPGHTWVKARYIDPAPLGYSIQRSEFINPWTKAAVVRERVFIPSKLKDNRFLGDDYVANLYMSGSAELVRAWLDGDWTVIEGAFFDCWDATRHIARPFAVPDDWPRFWSGDWGSAKPFSFGLWAVVAEKHKTPDGLWLPRGALLRTREWYGCIEGRPNTGLKLPAEKVGEGLWERTKPLKPRANVLDPACFASDGGPSIAERLMGGAKAVGGSLPFRAADNKRIALKGALGGWDQMRSRMIGDADGLPMIACFSTCTDSIRTIPALQHDAHRPEDVDTEGEDHAGDDWRYACMSRPWTPPDRPKPKPRDSWAYDDEGSGASWKAA